MQLMKPLFGKGYNVTCNNFFMNKKLPQQLLQQCTTIVGTVRANRWELPPPKKLDVYTSQFFQAGGCHLTHYQAKCNKLVYLLSTQHGGCQTQHNGKKKPKTVLYYNVNKFGMDALDAMCCQMSTKARCMRWPLAIFYNILDLTGLIAWILFTKSTGSNINW